jgi:hypothetical protein
MPDKVLPLSDVQLPLVILWDEAFILSYLSYYFYYLMWWFTSTQLSEVKGILIPAYPRAGKQFRMPLKYLKVNG